MAVVWRIHMVGLCIDPAGAQAAVQQPATQAQPQCGGGEGVGQQLHIAVAQPHQGSHGQHSTCEHIECQACKRTIGTLANSIQRV